MKKRFHIGYTERVKKFIYSCFEAADSGSIVHKIKSNYVHIDIHSFSSGKHFDDTVYATCGMGARKQNASLDEYRRIELFSSLRFFLISNSLFNLMLLFPSKHCFAGTLLIKKSFFYFFCDLNLAGSLCRDRPQQVVLIDCVEIC